MGTTAVRLKNTSPHLKHISLAGGELITIPPTETGVGIEIKLESDAERATFQKALETPAVKAWIDAGELVVEGAQPVDKGPVPAQASPPPQMFDASAEPPVPPPPAPTPAFVPPADVPTTSRRGGRDRNE